MTQKIDHVFIEESVRHHPFTSEVLRAQSQWQGVLPEATIIADKEKFPAGKNALILRQSRGEIFHTCPGTKEAVCCNYFVFDFLSGCPFDCSYCYLQAYLNEGGLNLQVDIERPTSELVERARREKSHLFRVGTGELADSLALAASDPLNAFLVETLSREQNIQLELKTKSNRVHALLPLDPKGRVVVSWSMSPQRISIKEDKGTATIDERLAAAQKVLDAGYHVAFHFDPLIYSHTSFEEWAKDYSELVEHIFSIIPSEKILWLSTGGLRLIKGLRDIMMSEHRDSRIAFAEFVPGRDGKMRYPKSLRKRMFAHLHAEISRQAKVKAPPLYLCMEARDTWNGALGGTPRMDHESDLRPLFSNAIPRGITI